MSIFWSPNAILRKKLAVCSHNQIRLCPGLFATGGRQTPEHHAVRGPQEDLGHNRTSVLLDMKHTAAHSGTWEPPEGKSPDLKSRRDAFLLLDGQGH